MPFNLMCSANIYSVKDSDSTVKGQQSLKLLSKAYDRAEVKATKCAKDENHTVQKCHKKREKCTANKIGCKESNEAVQQSCPKGLNAKEEAKETKQDECGEIGAGRKACPIKLHMQVIGKELMKHKHLNSVQEDTQEELLLGNYDNKSIGGEIPMSKAKERMQQQQFMSENIADSCKEQEVNREKVKQTGENTSKTMKEKMGKHNQGEEVTRAKGEVNLTHDQSERAHTGVLGQEHDLPSTECKAEEGQKVNTTESLSDHHETNRKNRSQSAGSTESTSRNEQKDKKQ